MADPPNPLELAQAIAAMLTRCDEQTALLRELVAQGRAPRPEHHHQPPAPGYPEVLAIQPPLFHEADEPLEADSWFGPSSPSLPCTDTMMGIKQDWQPSS